MAQKKGPSRLPFYAEIWPGDEELRTCHVYFFQLRRAPAGDEPDEVKAAVAKLPRIPIYPRNMDGPESRIGYEIVSGVKIIMPDQVETRRSVFLRALRESGNEAAAEFYRAHTMAGRIQLEAAAGRIILEVVTQASLMGE